MIPRTYIHPEGTSDDLSDGRDNLDLFSTWTNWSSETANEIVMNRTLVFVEDVYFKNLEHGIN